MKTVAKLRFPLWFSAFLGGVFLTSAVAVPPDDLEPFLAEHCYDCHDEDVQKGDLDLASLELKPWNMSNAEIWERVFQRVEGGEMPPVKKPRPEKKAKAKFLHGLEKPLVAAGAKRQAALGRVHTRRLTRVEYEHSVQELLGIDLPLKPYLPEDPGSGGFQTVAEVQQLSHFHLNYYLEAADLALEEALTRLTKGDSTYERTFIPKDLLQNNSGNFRGPQVINNKVHFWHLGVQFGGRLTSTRVKEDGHYRIKLKNVRGVHGGPDKTTWGSLQTGYGYSNSPLMSHVDVIEATAEPKDVIIDAWMNKDDLILIRPDEGTNKRARPQGGGGNVNYKGTNFLKQACPAIVIDSLSMKRIYPNGNRKGIRDRLLPGVVFEDGKPKLAKGPEAELDRVIRDFASRAFRRPATDEQIAPYLELAHAATKKAKGSLIPGLRAAYRAILCSPRFLTLVESTGELDDYAIASRLSYTFWNTLPDPKLLALAKKGELSTPKNLLAQVDRLLYDPRASRFIESFTDQWLDLREINFTIPDPKRFSEFDGVAQASMLAETRSFLQHLLKEDLSVKNLIEADFSMINTRLAALYKLKGTKLKPGGGLQKVSLKDGNPRGGLVTHGSVLKVTADGSVTSPILRGVWIAERILGMEIAPPPPNIPAVEPDIRGATSIRDELEKHRSDESCNGCHAKIDPAGFALESFDPIGRLRTAYGPGKNAAQVDPSGITPDGEKFGGIWQWKEIYQSKPDLLARSFAGQFLTYATGAKPTFADGPDLDLIVEQVAKKNHGLRSLVHACVESRIFLHK